MFRELTDNILDSQFKIPRKKRGVEGIARLPCGSNEPSCLLKTREKARGSVER